MPSRTGPLAGKVALVTGAGSGIGRAIAVALDRAGARLCLVGRREAPLAETAASLSDAIVAPADLGGDAGIQKVHHTITKLVGSLDILVHCAALYSRGPIAREPVSDFDALYGANVRAPYALTQAFLPGLCAAHGEVVFVNSTAVGASTQNLAQYAATKQALQAIANSLRAEVNAAGVRVLSVYVGRTATPMQAKVLAAEHRVYAPERLLQPEDVAASIVHALTLPRTAEITDLTIRPMLKN